MKYIFFIKGDGRGHLTQALSLARLLTERGHQVQALVVGAPPDALIPPFFQERASAPVAQVDSPNFVLNKAATRIDFLATGLAGIRRFGSYRRSLAAVRTLLDEHKPDVLINLYDPILPLYALTHKRVPPIVTISHQNLMLHRGFRFPPGRELERRMVVNYTRLLRRGGIKHLALSFHDLPPDAERAIVPVPPLLRREVFERQPTAGRHLLVYMVYHGFSEMVKDFNRRHPEVEVHAFYSKKGVPAEEKISDTLTFHTISDVKFLDMLASARGVATTAGFETVCEAFYYRKPALLMPMPGQYEQFVNAYDAEQVGAGLMAPDLDPSRLEAFIPQYAPRHAEFLAWLESGAERFVAHLENPALALN